MEAETTLDATMKTTTRMSDVCPRATALSGDETVGEKDAEASGIWNLPLPPQQPINVVPPPPPPPAPAPAPSPLCSAPVSGTPFHCSPPTKVPPSESSPRKVCGRDDNTNTFTPSAKKWSRQFNSSAYSSNIHSSNCCLSYKYPFSNAIVCANCGRTGHVYRSCNLPITSFGVICFRWTYDPHTGTRAPQYLMVQRKDSLCFVEFIRGRYDLYNKPYVMHLLTKMTRAEREHIRTLSFPELWHGFWQSDQNRGYMREFHQAQEKFNALRRGIVLPDTREYVDLTSLMNATCSQHDEKEWGFPKGRRNINEKDIKCALREFREETGIDVQDVHVHNYVKPFEEVFTACNKVRYKHVYYIVQLKQDQDADALEDDKDVCLLGDKSQMREISRVRWLDEQTVDTKINADNKERRDMFRRVHALIMETQVLHKLKLSWIARSDVPTLPSAPMRPTPSRPELLPQPQNCTSPFVPLSSPRSSNVVHTVT